jgi:protocatechuate 3,4-dioxygenase beta subunit
MVRNLVVLGFRRARDGFRGRERTARAGSLGLVLSIAAAVPLTGIVGAQTPKSRPWPLSPLSLSGRVLDSEGAAIAGARVGVHAWRSGDESPPEWATSAAADGGFELELPPFPGLEPGLTLVFRAAGFAPARIEYGAWRPLEIPADGALDVGDVVLEPGVSIRGRVVGAESGAPLAGAEVVAYDDRPGDEVESVTTDEDGRFLLEHRPRSGAMAVKAASRATRSVFPFRETAARFESTVDLGDVALRPGAELHGTVVDERGNPLAGVEVWDGPIAAGLVARTDDGGRFVLHGLEIPRSAPRTVGVAARLDGFRGGGGPLAVTSHAVGSERRLDLVRPIVMRRLGELAVEVVDQDGAPVAGAEVSVWLPGTGVQESVRTDADGRARVRVLEPGIHRMSARAPGHRAAEAAATASVEGTPVSLVLERYESGQLVVRAVAETGAELDAGLVVTARAEDPELAWSGGQERIDADGIAVFDALAIGRYRVAPWATECEEVEPVFADVVPGSADVDLRLDCSVEERERLTVQGAVFDPAGAPIEGANVVVDYSSSVRSGPDGGFRVELAPAPFVNLQIEAPGHAPWCRSIDRRGPGCCAGTEELGRIVLEPGATVEVVVEGADPAAPVRVSAGSEDCLRELEAVVVDGAHRLSGLPPGAGWITASSGSASVRETVELVSGEHRRLVLSLPARHRVTGTVRVDGRPPDHASVMLFASRPDLEFDAGAEVDDLGRFAIEGVPAGEATLQLWLDGAGITRAVEVGPDTEVEIALAVGSIVGIVRNADTGNPRSGVLVVALPPGAMDHSPTPVARSGSDGTFVFEDLVEGEWRIGLEPSQRNLELVDGGRASFLVPVTLDGSGPKAVTLAVREREER